MSEHDRRSSSTPGPGASSLVQRRLGHAPLAPGKQTLVQQLAASPSICSGTEPRNAAPTAGVPSTASRELVGYAQPPPFAGLIQRSSSHDDVDSDLADGMPALTLESLAPNAGGATSPPVAAPAHRKATAAGAAGSDRPAP